MSILASRIKSRREELKLSQDDLAKKIGYKSRSTIAKIESGDNDIPQSKIKSFAEALNTSVAYLMGLEIDINYIGYNVQYFYKTLKHFRLEFHLTQTELEEKLKLPSGIVSKLENSESAPTDELLEKLADFFNIFIYDLLDDYHGIIFKRIKNVIRSLNIKLNEFCETIGIVEDLYNNWENGISKSYILYLEIISKKYDVPIEYLWGDIDTNIYTGEEFLSHSVALTPEEERLIAHFRNLNKIGQEEAVKRIEELTYIEKYK